MKKIFKNFLEGFFHDYGCSQNFEDILKYFFHPSHKEEKKKLIAMLDDLIQENNWETWPDYFKEAGLKITYREAEDFIKTLYAELTDKSLPKDMLQYFIENYFNLASNTNSLEPIINDFKDLEKPEDQKQLMVDLHVIINANDYEKTSLKINEYCLRKMDPKETEEFVKFLYSKLI